MSNVRLRVAIYISLLAASGAARAQSSEGGLEEVVVTAQRRAEAIQDVPIAITALTGAQLERLNVGDTLDLVRLVPNAFASNNTGLGTANVYSIRGLNNTESIATFDPPVGTYVDDVFIARQNANNFAFFDVERVEVLRGPQGTLFGRNTTGGAVNVILKKPGEEFGGYAEVGFGQFNRRTARFSIDMPASETLLTKLSAYYAEDDGYVWNLTTGEKLNADDNKGVRFAVRWLASDSLTWDVAADYIDQSYMNILNGELAGSGDDARISRTGMRTDTAATRGIFVNDKQNFPLGNEVKSTSFTSNIGWQTGVGTVNFITGWRSLEQDFALDFFNGPLTPTGAFTIANHGEHDQFTQEIKLTGQALDERLDYVVGAYWFDEENETDLGQLFAIRGLLPFPGFTPFPQYGVTVINSQYYDRTMYNDGEALAFYGQVDFDILDTLTLTAGIRWTDEEKTIAYKPNANPKAPPANQWDTGDLRAAGIPTKQSTDEWTPRVALKWAPNEDLNFFASATNGFKSGGWNARNVNVVEAQPFGPETVWSYELGMRSDWLDNRVRLNLTAFMSDVEDYQLPSAFVPPTGGIVFITRNFADLDVEGIEAEFNWAPLDGLNVFVTAGWQDGEYTNLDPSITAQQQLCQSQIAAGLPPAQRTGCTRGIVDPNGSIADPVRLPDYTITAGASYTFALGGGGLELTPGFFVQDVGDYNVGTSGEAVALSDGYTSWNAGITLAHPENGWSLQANCDNCTNELILASVLAGQQYFQTPRTWMMRFKYDW
jgi:iron complex outermembrane receptor protein